MLCKFLIASTHNYRGTHAYGYFILGCFYHCYLQMPASCYYMNDLIHATLVHPSLCLQYFNPAVYYNRCYCCFYFITARRVAATMATMARGEFRVWRKIMGRGGERRAVYIRTRSLVPACKTNRDKRSSLDPVCFTSRN